MGKRIIIKGADFSENAIINASPILAIDCNNDIANATRAGTITTAPFADLRYANLYDKTVVGIELKPETAGNITIVSLYNGTITDKASVTITNDMINVKTYFPLDIQVRFGEILGVFKSGDTGRIYISEVTETEGFITRLGSASQSTAAYGLAINWYVQEP